MWGPPPSQWHRGLHQPKSGPGRWGPAQVDACGRHAWMAPILFLQGFHCFNICYVMLCSRLQLSPLAFVTSLYYFLKFSTVYLAVCYVTALFSAAIVPSSVCYVTTLFIKGFHC